MDRDGSLDLETKLTNMRGPFVLHIISLHECSTSALNCRHILYLDYRKGYGSQATAWRYPQDPPSTSKHHMCATLGRYLMAMENQLSSWPRIERHCLRQIGATQEPLQHRACNKCLPKNEQAKLVPAVTLQFIHISLRSHINPCISPFLTVWVGNQLDEWPFDVVSLRSLQGRNSSSQMIHLITHNHYDWNMWPQDMI